MPIFLFKNFDVHNSAFSIPSLKKYFLHLHINYNPSNMKNYLIKLLISTILIVVISHFLKIQITDYTAAIFAYCLNAESVTIWKDVPGVMNADPRYFENASLLNQISYREAIELAFYGATVIHPKTLQPLQKKEIPLYVKSFINPLLKGTSVSRGADLEPHLPCFIVKRNQLLISLSSIDFSFIMEENISEIFALFHQFKLKVNLIQNSAISFSVCVEDKFGNFKEMNAILSKKFKVDYNENVTLYTIRHFDEAASQTVEKNKLVLLKQVSRETMQVVTKEV